MPIRYRTTSPDFDSELARTSDRENGRDLTILLRLRILAVVSRDNTVRSRTGSWRIRSWSDDALSVYKSSFKQIVEREWSNRIFLRFPDTRSPTDALRRSVYQALQNPGLIGRKTPFLRCKLRIDYTDAANAHAVIRLFRLEPGQPPFQAVVDRRVGAPDVANFTDQMLTQRTHDREQRLQQIPAVHEVGHLLGFPHVNAGHRLCSSNPNADVCYGVDPYQMRDIMGVGDAISGRHAGPWITAIGNHTGHTRGWTATHVEPPLEELMDAAIRSRP